MCRNIRVLHHFQPPTSPEEIRAAALQYVRKVSGLRAPGKNDAASFERAIDAITAATTELLDALAPPKTPPRTREGEKHRARERWAARKSRIVGEA